MATVDIEFRTRLNDLKRELASIDGLTKKQASQIAGDWQRAWKSAEKDGTGSLQKVSKEAGNLAKLGSLIGGDLGGAIGNIADASEIAAEGLSGTAVAVGAIGAGIGGVIAVGAAITNVLTNLDDYRDTLSDLEKRDIITAQQRRGVEAASALVAVLGGYVEDFAVLLATYAAPTILNFAKGSVFAFEFLRSIVSSTFVELGSVLGRFGEVLTSGFDAGALARYQGAVDELINVTGDFEDAQGSAQAAVSALITETLQERRRALAAYRADQDKSTTSTERETEAHDGLRESLLAEAAAYDVARAAVFNANLTRQAEAEAALAGQASKNATLKQASIDAAAQHAAELARVAELNEAQQQAHAADLQRQQERTAAAGQYLSAASSVISSISALYNDLTNSQIDSMRKGSAEQRAALRKQFAANKAIALVQAGVNTALGVTQALASAPPPASFVLGALALAAGIAQIAVIARQQPSFHTGGVVRAAPDEVGVNARAGEGVLTNAGVSAVGGEEALRDLNRGRRRSGDGVTVAAMVVDGRVTDALWRGGSRGADGLRARIRAHLSGGLMGRESYAYG